MTKCCTDPDRQQHREFFFFFLFFTFAKWSDGSNYQNYASTEMQFKRMKIIIKSFQFPIYKEIFFKDLSCQDSWKFWFSRQVFLTWEITITITTPHFFPFGWHLFPNSWKMSKSLKVFSEYEILLFESWNTFFLLMYWKWVGNISGLWERKWYT